MTLKIKPAKTKVENWIIASDWHIEKMHQPSFNILKSLAQILGHNKTNLIILGDFLDCHYLMRKDENFQKWSKRPDGIDSYFLAEFEKEVELGISILKDLSPLFKRKIFVAGNHEYRVDLFRESSVCPVGYKHNFNISDALGLPSLGFEYVAYNEWIDLGENLSLTHGAYHGPSALKKHFDVSGGKSVVYGHVHTSECKSFASRGKTKKVWSLPTMATLNPEYMRNMPNAWSNGFNLCQLKPNSNFQMHILEVWDDELILPTGQIIKG